MRPAAPGHTAPLWCNAGAFVTKSFICPEKCVAYPKPVQAGFLSMPGILVLSSSGMLMESVPVPRITGG